MIWIFIITISQKVQVYIWGNYYPQASVRLKLWLPVSSVQNLWKWLIQYIDYMQDLLIDSGLLPPAPAVICSQRMQWYGSQPPYGAILEDSCSNTNTISLCLWSGPIELKLRNNCTHCAPNYFVYLLLFVSFKGLVIQSFKNNVKSLDESGFCVHSHLICDLMCFET